MNECKRKCVMRVKMVNIYTLVCVGMFENLKWPREMGLVFFSFLFFLKR